MSTRKAFEELVFGSARKIIINEKLYFFSCSNYFPPSRGTFFVFSRSSRVLVLLRDENRNRAERKHPPSPVLTPLDSLDAKNMLRWERRRKAKTFFILQKKLRNWNEMFGDVRQRGIQGKQGPIAYRQLRGGSEAVSFNSSLLSLKRVFFNENDFSWKTEESLEWRARSSSAMFCLIIKRRIFLCALLFG